MREKERKSLIGTRGLPNIACQLFRLMANIWFCSSTSLLKLIINMGGRESGKEVSRTSRHIECF